LDRFGISSGVAERDDLAAARKKAAILRQRFGGYKNAPAEREDKQD